MITANNNINQYLVIKHRLQILRNCHILFNSLLIKKDLDQSSLQMVL